MKMNEQMQSGMAEATRLTQQGRLDEATAAIQRALSGTFVPTKEPGGSDEGPIDVTSRIVKEVRQGPAAGRRTAGRGPGAATWPTPQPNLLTRGVANPPGMTVGRAASAEVPE